MCLDLENAKKCSGQNLCLSAKLKKRCFAEAIQRLGINSADPDETGSF